MFGILCWSLFIPSEKFYHDPRLYSSYDRHVMNQKNLQALDQELKIRNNILHGIPQDPTPNTNPQTEANLNSNSYPHPHPHANANPIPFPDPNL